MRDVSTKEFTKYVRHKVIIDKTRAQWNQLSIYHCIDKDKRPTLLVFVGSFTLHPLLYSSLCYKCKAYDTTDQLISGKRGWPMLDILILEIRSS